MPRRAKTSPKVAGYFRSVILCDDIRQEKSNKLILIGVYTGDIVLPTLPGAIAPQLFAEYVASPDEVVSGDLSFSATYMAGDDVKGVMRGEFKIAEGLTINILLPPIVLEFKEPAELRLEFNFGDDEFAPHIVAFTKKVLLASSAPSPTA